MTTQKYIDENETKTFKKGDKVVMFDCGEAKHYKGRVWVCETSSFTTLSKCEVVFLEGFSGSFVAKFLKKNVKQ